MFEFSLSELVHLGRAGDFLRFPLLVVSECFCFWSLVESDDEAGLISLRIAAAKFFSSSWAVDLCSKGPRLEMLHKFTKVMSVHRCAASCPALQGDVCSGTCSWSCFGKVPGLEDLLLKHQQEPDLGGLLSCPSACMAAA